MKSNVQEMILRDVSAIHTTSPESLEQKSDEQVTAVARGDRKCTCCTAGCSGKCDHKAEEKEGTP